MYELELFTNIAPSVAQRLWMATYGERYRVPALLMNLNTFHAPDYLPMTSGFTSDYNAFIVTKWTAQFVDAPRQGYISALAYEDSDAASYLIQRALQYFASQGIEQVSFGQDVGHFFPGCPKECYPIHALLTNCGFTPSDEVHDLERDLTNYSPDRVDGDIRWCTSDDQESLFEFLDREFPGRWPYDVRRKAQAENGLDFILGMFDGPECMGFAVIQKDGADNLPLGGAVWQASLGSKWGALGPIGVAKKVRGQGLGDALLTRSLDLLKRLGVRRCIIDWTAIPGFYERHGFEISRTYVPMRAVTSMLPK